MEEPARVASVAAAAVVAVVAVARMVARADLAAAVEMGSSASRVLEALVAAPVRLRLIERSAAVVRVLVGPCSYRKAAR
jgi:hypothetical protein